MARILLVLQQQGNRRLLGEWLARHYEVVTAETIPAGHDSFDLAILDGPSLERLRHAVQARKQQEEPVFLPCVLLTPRQQARIYTSLATKHAVAGEVAAARGWLRMAIRRSPGFLPAYNSFMLTLLGKRGISLMATVVRKMKRRFRKITRWAYPPD